MTLSVVPCFSDPSWSMSVTLEGVLYNFQFDWNERGACWYLSLADVDGVDIYNGVKLVIGFPLLGKCKDHRKPPGEFFVISATSDQTPPGQFDLLAGGKNQLLYLSSDWLSLIQNGQLSQILTQIASGSSTTSPVSTYGQSP